MQAGLDQVLRDASPTRTMQGRHCIFPRVEEGGQKNYFELILKQGGRNKSIYFCVIVMDALMEWTGKLHSMRVGWRNFFSSCAVVSVFGSGGK
jgi:hypothetical protein